MAFPDSQLKTCERRRHSLSVAATTDQHRPVGVENDPLCDATEYRFPRRGPLAPRHHDLVAVVLEVVTSGSDRMIVMEKGGVVGPTRRTA
jgi:hypothetical protein